MPVRLSNGQRVQIVVTITFNVARHSFENRVCSVLRELNVANVVLGLTLLDEAQVSVHYGKNRVITLTDGGVQISYLKQQNAYPLYSSISAIRLVKLMRETARGGKGSKAP